jgi:hypothetical protein
MYTAPELLDGNNKYHCEICDTKQPAHRRVVLKSLPPILSISCQRFDIDRTTWQRVKVTTRCEFPLSMDMSLCLNDNIRTDPNLSSPISEDPNVEADRTNIFRQKMVFIDNVVKNANEEAQRLIDTYGIDVDISKILSDANEYTTLQRKLQSVHTFYNTSGCATDYIYELFGVIMHGGSAYSGHYTAYIKDTLGEGVWTLPKLENAKSKSNKGKSGIDGKKCFIRSKTGDLIVNEISPLNSILTIMQSSEHNNKNMSNSRKVIELSKLGGAIKANLGNTWNNIYLEEYGALNAFIKNHDIFFSLEAGNSVGLKDIHYRVVDADVFANEVNGAASTKLDTESKEIATDVPSTIVNYTDLDEALAKSLSLEDNDDVCQPQTDVKEQEEQWEEVGGDKKKKKSRKQANKERAKLLKSNAPANISIVKTDKNKKVQNTPASAKSKSLSTDAISSSKDVSTNTEAKKVEEEAPVVEDEKSLKLRELRNRLLNEFHGSFFLFNDSSVSPIEISSLVDAFDGRCSAYILIYRLANHSSRNSTKNSEQLAMPPAICLKEVEKMNSELEQQRSDYERLGNCYSVTIYFPTHLQNDWPIVKMVPVEKLIGVIDDSMVQGLQLDVDIRSDIKSLMDLICSKIKGQEILLHLGNKNTKFSVNNYAIGKLETYGRSGMYLKSPYNDNDIVADVLASGCHLYFVKRKDITDNSFCTMTLPPKALQITYEDLNGNSTKNEPLNTLDLVVPSTTSLYDLSLLVSSHTGIALGSMRLYTIHCEKVTSKKNGKDSEYSYSLLWTNGNISKPWSPVATYDSLPGTEVIVEDISNQKPSKNHLAEREVMRRNRLWTISVELDYTGNLTQLMKDYALGGLYFPIPESIKVEKTANFENTSSLSTTVQVRILHHCIDTSISSIFF